VEPAAKRNLRPIGPTHRGVFRRLSSIHSSEALKLPAGHYDIRLGEAGKQTGLPNFNQMRTIAGSNMAFNVLKVTFLLALMTAIFVGMGALVGGQIGLRRTIIGSSKIWRSARDCRCRAFT
jgi:hypothetical protein